MYISDLHKGLIYTAVRSVRWSKYIWRTVDPVTLEEHRVPTKRVPRRIRKCAYGMFWRDTIVNVTLTNQSQNPIF